MGGGTVEVTKKYVSRKIKSIRWKPPVTNDMKEEIFLSGSWDDEENNLCVWKLNDEGEAAALQEIPQISDVNYIQYITRDLLAIGTGNGSIMLYKHNSSAHLDCKVTWEKQHRVRKGPVPSTCLASNGEQVASVGEDGRLIIFHPNKDQPVKVIDSESCCSDYAVIFVKANEILSASMQGHLRLWDLRADDHPKCSLLSPDQVSVLHLANHPTQQHLVAAAGEDGALALWDMRSTSQPLAIITAHKGPISQVQFHPSKSDHLFTCGFDAQVLHWDASSSSSSKMLARESKNIESRLTNAWLTDDVAQGAIDMENLIPPSYLPINSLHMESNTLLAGTDDEAIYIIRNVL